jgi:uncharacterized protein
MIWTAIILGFAGSFHCLGMCSPLAMAVTNRSQAILLNKIFYNFGRVLTYSLLGGLIASIGLMAPMIKYQNLLSVFLGIGLVAIGIRGVSTARTPVISNGLAKLNIFLKKVFARFLKHKSYSSTFFLGSLNGFLPCGLSFLALTYCVTLSGPLDGFYFMALFGVGTLPVMLGFTFIFQWALNTFHLNSRRLTTTMLIVSGVLLIARVFIAHISESEFFAGSATDIIICR